MRVLLANLNRGNILNEYNNLYLPSVACVYNTKARGPRGPEQIILTGRKKTKFSGHTSQPRRITQNMKQSLSLVKSSRHVLAGNCVL